MINRRNLLVGIVGAMASGAILTKAEAGSDMGRYDQLIVQAKMVVALSDQIKTADDAVYDVLQAELNVATDDLLAQMLNEFNGEIAVEDVRGLFANRLDLNGLTEQKLALLADGAVPVAVMRELLHVHHVNFSPKECSHWNQFMARYKDVLLAV